MRLSKLRACDSCGGPVGLSFHVVRTSGAFVGGPAAQQVMGLMAIYNGALEIAESMAPAADDAVAVFMDEDKTLQTELFLCQDCFGEALGSVVEKIAEQAA